MITTRAILRLLESMCEDMGVSWEIGSEMPSKPDRLALITRGPGGRTEMEGLIDRGTFTIIMRGRPTDDEQPELDLEDIRLRMEAARYPIEVGNHSIISMWPAGPSYPLPNPDNGRRFSYVQTINLQVSTDI